MERFKIVFTDLDRTLLRDDNTLSQRNRSALERLKKKGIRVVIATGRNLFSFHKVMHSDLPIDYLMLSSGCGIIDWETKQVIYENHLSQDQADRVFEIMQAYKLDFMIHHLIPDNHHFSFIRNNRNNADFEHRIQIYRDYAEEMVIKPLNASQFIAILPPEAIKLFETVKNEIDFLQVIRATSPLDHRSIWLEVFPKGISKGHSAQWLCTHLGIDRKQTLGIGNDFNDIDLLDFTAQSFVVANAPEEIKGIYDVVDSNQNDGFAKCIEELLG